MKNVKISIYLDAMFLFVSVFSLSLVLIKLYLPFTLSLIFSSILSGIIVAIYYKKSTEKLNILKGNKAEEEQKTNVLNQLSINSVEENNKIIENALKNLGYHYVFCKGNIILTDKNAVIYPAFSFETLTRSDIIRAFNKREKDEKVFILTNEVTKEIQEFTEKFNGVVKIMKGDDVYAFLKKANAIPKITVILKKEKLQFKEIFKSFFRKEKSKRYLFFSLMLLFLSFISPFKLYYVLSGALLLLTSIFCRFYGKKDMYEKETL